MPLHSSPSLHPPLTLLSHSPPPPPHLPPSPPHAPPFPITVQYSTTRSESPLALLKSVEKGLSLSLSSSSSSALRLRSSLPSLLPIPPNSSPPHAVTPLLSSPSLSIPLLSLLEIPHHHHSDRECTEIMLYYMRRYSIVRPELHLKAVCSCV